jgi:hypothetical protein
LENRILVRFETSDNLFSNRYDLRVKKESNILCFDESGNLLWEIEEAPKLDSLGGPFGKMFLDNGKILTYHQMGCDFEIDLNSGKVKAKTQGRPW